MRIQNDSAAYLALQQLQQPLVRKAPDEGQNGRAADPAALPPLPGPQTVAASGVASQNLLFASPRIDAADAAADEVASLADRIAADAGEAVQAQAHQPPAGVLRLISGNQE
jgi:hypothetical protein